MRTPEILLFLLMTTLLGSACRNASTGPAAPDDREPWRITRTVVHDGVPVQVIIDKPAGILPGQPSDVLITFHGTVWLDHLILEAAENVLGVFRRTLDRSDLLIVSVAYPQENKLVGDGLREAEAALLWVKSRLGAEHGIPVRRIFLAGHSQGGYIVTRLNTMHPTDGVVANAPGPLDVEFRCQLEERGEVGRTPLCDLMRSRFGTTAEAPQPYIERSLLSFTRDFTSDILFVQGLNDGAIQLRSWPMFQAEVDACETCADAEFLNLPGAGHDALFTSPQARIAFNNFLNVRR